MAHALLRRAGTYVSAELPQPGLAPDIGFDEAEELLSERTLQEAMDALAAHGDHVHPRPGFWRDLERAAEAIELDGHASAYKARFHVALNSPTNK